MLYFLIILAVGVIFLGLKSFKVVPQQEAYVVERWASFTTCWNQACASWYPSWTNWPTAIL